MKRKEMLIIKITVSVLMSVLLCVVFTLFSSELSSLGVDIVLLSVRSYLPSRGIAFGTSQDEGEAQAPSEKAQSLVKREETNKKDMDEKENKNEAAEVVMKYDEGDYSYLAETDKDILELIASRQKSSGGDERDGDIEEYHYDLDGVTDRYGLVKVKNTNETGIDIEKKLKEKIDLSVSKSEPSVLIFHTHTTETYQLLDRGFYETGFQTRTDDEKRNMVRVGKAICEQLERAGYSVIHDTEIHDGSYSGAYDRSRESVEQYLKKYPSIQVVLDIHRDAIQESDGTKIKPVSEINGKKAAQLMIISGCQEPGNGITDLPDWEYNLTFAVHLQNKLEQLFEGITRPLYFCPRSYNMNLTHCSLLIEVGSDSNTLDEAVYSGKCLGAALAEILEEYEEEG